MENIYSLADKVIMSKIGTRLKSMRLKQNITQQVLSEESGMSLSSVKKIENGEIHSFDSFIRVLRTLGKLDVLQPLVEEESLSPSEYYDLVQKANAGQRKHATGRVHKTVKEESKW